MSIRRPFFELSPADRKVYLADLACILAYHRHRSLLPDATHEDAMAYASRNGHHFKEQALTYAAALEVDEETSPRGEGLPCPSVRVSPPA